MRRPRLALLLALAWFASCVQDATRIAVRNDVAQRVRGEPVRVFTLGQYMDDALPGLALIACVERVGYGVTSSAARIAVARAVGEELGADLVIIGYEVSGAVGGAAFYCYRVPSGKVGVMLDRDGFITGLRGREDDLLRPGDRVVAVDGSPRDTPPRNGDGKPGDIIPITVMRSGEAVTVNVPLVENPPTHLTLEEAAPPKPPISSNPEF